MTCLAVTRTTFCPWTCPPEGDFYLSGGTDDAVYLWNAHTNEKIYRRIFEDIVVCVRFSKDQQRFAVADRNNIVSVHETSTGKLLRTIGPFEEDVTSLGFHPNKPVLALGFFGNDSSRDGSRRVKELTKNRPANLLMVDVNTGATLQTIEGHGDEVSSIEFDFTGDRLVTGCMDGLLRIWDAENSDAEIDYTLTREIHAHSKGVRGVDISSDGLMAVSGGADKIATIWNVETGSVISHLTGHTSVVSGVDLSPSGQLVATVSNDQTMIIWDLNGNAITTWKGHAGPINEVKFTADSKQVVTVSDDKTLRRWNVDKITATMTHDFKHAQVIWRACFSPDKSLVAVACENGTVTLLDAVTGKVKRELSHDEKAVLSLVWLSDGRLITAGDDFGLRVWGGLDRSGDVQQPVRTVALPECMVWDISVSPDETLLIVACTDCTARIFDATTYQEVGKLEGHKQAVSCARFSVDGKFIVTASDDQTIRVWDANTRAYLYSLKGHGHEIWRAVVSPTDPNLIASSAADGKIMLWDLEKREPLPITFEGHTSPVAGLTFTADGRSLVSASDDDTVRVWDIGTGVELFVFQDQPSKDMIDATFSRDGQSLVTTGTATVKVRHASARFKSPYLKRDAKADVLKWEIRVTEDDVSDADLEEAVQTYQKVINSYPSGDAFSRLGIAQYRLGQYADAVHTLLEAMRLEEIIPRDQRPLTKGYLAMAYRKTGNLEKAREIQASFDKDAEQWGGDLRVEDLTTAVHAVVGE